MALSATLSARKVCFCGSGFQPRQDLGKMPFPQSKETNLLESLTLLAGLRR
jgi:hypothetical protein